MELFATRLTFCPPDTQQDKALLVTAIGAKQKRLHFKSMFVQKLMKCESVKKAKCPKRHVTLFYKMSNGQTSCLMKACINGCLLGFCQPLHVRTFLLLYPNSTLDNQKRAVSRCLTMESRLTNMKERWLEYQIELEESMAYMHQCSLFGDCRSILALLSQPFETLSLQIRNLSI